MITAGAVRQGAAQRKGVRWETLRRNVASVLFVIAMLVPITEQVFAGSLIFDSAIFLNVGFLLVALALNGFRVPTAIFRVVLPLVLLCILGIVSSAESAQYYDIAKDVWYVMNPCIIVATGFFLGYLINDFRRLIICTFIVGTIFAAYHVAQFIINPSVIAQDLRSMRREAGFGEFSSALCLGILFALYWHKISWRRISVFLCSMALVFCVASQFLGLSRIWWVCLFVICFSAAGLLRIKRLSLWVSPAIVAALLALAVPFVVPVSNIEQTASSDSRFVQKMLNSINEITPRDFTSLRDVNENWRGYESYRGMLYFRNGNWGEILFGRGFGALTDLGLLIRLKDSIFRVIPWFHNGFVFLLIKTGVVGVCLYLSFVFILIRYGMQGYESSIRAISCLSTVLVGSALSLMLATAVFAGPFNRSRFISALLFIGASLALQRRLFARQKLLMPARRPIPLNVRNAAAISSLKPSPNIPELG